jgi:hypothetical protein
MLGEKLVEYQYKDNGKRVSAHQGHEITDVVESTGDDEDTAVARSIYAAFIQYMKDNGEGASFPGLVIYGTTNPGENATPLSESIIGLNIAAYIMAGVIGNSVGRLSPEMQAIIAEQMGQMK